MASTASAWAVEKRSLSDASTTDSEDEVLVDRRCEGQWLRKSKAKAGLEVQEASDIEPEVDVSTSFFPVAAIFCHFILLMGLCHFSDAPIAALLTPSVILGACAAARSGFPRGPLSPGAALQMLFAVQMVALMTWWVHSAYAAPIADVCAKQ